MHAFFYYSTEPLNLLDFMMNPTADNNILGHVHKYQAVLWRHWKNQEKLFFVTN